MEFSLPLELDADSVVSKQWNNFYQRFTYYRCQNSCPNIESVLLFAAHDQINNVCTSLRLYDIDVIKLNKILKVIEQACLPSFILLYERFQFFTLQPNPFETLDETIFRLSKQTEMCQFGNMNESILNKAIRDIEVGKKQLSKNIANLNFKESKQTLHENDEESSFEDFQTTSISEKDAGSVFETVLPAGFKKDKSPKIKTQNKIKRKGEKKKWLKQQEKVSDKLNQDNEIAHQDSAVEESVTEGDEVQTCTVVAESTGINSLPASSHKKSLPSCKQYKKCKNLFCFLCGKAFAGVKWLGNHFLAHHPDCTNFSCTFCDGSWSNVTDYTNHFKLHFPELDRKRLRVKISDVNKTLKILSCIICNAKFVKETLLKDHMSDIHPGCNEFICAYCGKVYNDFSQYFRHTKRVHNLYARALTCDLCQAVFFQRKRLSIHLRKHLDLRQHQCEHCGKAYNERQMLVAHLRLHSMTKTHKCEICGKNFLAVSLLTKHIRSHTGEKPYTCELCGKSYGDISAFQYHQHWHAGEQPYACEICGKRTRSVGEKNKHKRVHSDKKPYVCEYCGKAFRFISNLIEHRKGHTGKRVHKCDFCGQSFIYRSGLTRHLQLRCPGNKSVTRKSRNLSAQLQTGTTSFVGMQHRADNQSIAETSQEEFLSWHSMIATYGMEGSSGVVLVPQF